MWRKRSVPCLMIADLNPALVLLLAIYCGLSSRMVAAQAPTQTRGAQRVDYTYQGHTFRFTIIGGDIRQVLTDGRSPMLVQDGKIKPFGDADPKAVALAQEAIGAYHSAPTVDSSNTAPLAQASPLASATGGTIAFGDPCSLLSQARISEVFDAQFGPGVLQSRKANHALDDPEKVTCSWTSNRQRGIQAMFAPPTKPTAGGAVVPGIGDEAYFKANGRAQAGVNLFGRESIMQIVVRVGDTAFELVCSANAMNDENMHKALEDLAREAVQRIRNGAIRPFQSH